MLKKIAIVLATLNSLVFVSEAKAQTAYHYHNRCVYVITEMVDTWCYQDNNTGYYHTFNGHTIRIRPNYNANYKCVGGEVLIDGSPGCKEVFWNQIHYIKLDGSFTFNYFTRTY